MRNLFQWPIWSWFCYFTPNIFALVTWPFRLVNSPRRDRTRIRGDEEQQLSAACSSLTDTVGTERAAKEQLLVIGIFARVYLLDGKIIRKSPRSDSEEDQRPITREAIIYNAIGDHSRIAECISRGSDEKYIDIKYYRHGDLASYCQMNRIPPDLQSKWFQQILEAVVVIHARGVIHSDLALRQFFVDDDLNLRLGDFNSSQCPGHPALGYEKATHCLPRDYELPNSEASDIFALGSTLYELVAGKAPYSELNPLESDDPDTIKAHIRRQHEVVDLEIEKKFKKQQFPDVTGLLGGYIIAGCWRGKFATAQEALKMYLESRN